MGVTAASKLAAAIAATVTGPMWHGPALEEVLHGVSAEQAAAHPIAGAHSIWELTLHIATWAEIPRARLAGTPRKEVHPHEDWPPVPPPTADAWHEATDRLRAAYRALAREVESLDDIALARRVPGHDYDAETMLRGVVEHGTYHGGQIALLRRAFR